MDPFDVTFQGATDFSVGLNLITAEMDKVAGEFKTYTYDFASSIFYFILVLAIYVNYMLTSDANVQTLPCLHVGWWVWP
jgi:hypothetical protein